MSLQVIPYLGFVPGTCAEAFRFYAEVLGGKIELMMTNGESPVAAEIPRDRHHHVMHVHLSLGSFALMGGDTPPEMHSRPQGFCVNLAVDTPAEAERIFGALSAGGSVTMPLHETFWAQRFGMFTDRYDIPWMINCAPAGA